MWKRCILLQAVAFGLLASWLIPASRALWDLLDHELFLFLNGSLHDRPLLQIFWAIANVKMTDLFGALFMALFFVLYLFDGPYEERSKRLAQALFVCLFGELGILFTKQLLGPFLEAYNLMREGPTFTYTNSIFLSDAIPWLKVKDHGDFCFPSDHAQIILQWTLFVFIFCGRKYGLMALPWALFFILPRLISGAHWVSDALIGSLAIALTIVAWACYSPLYNFLMFYIRKCTNRIYHEKSESSLRECL